LSTDCMVYDFHTKFTLKAIRPTLCQSNGKTFMDENIS
jgi:hypothetical protein